MITLVRSSKSPERPGLTEAQARVLSFFESAYAERCPNPTFRQICEVTGVGSANGISGHVKRLEHKGWIRRAGKVGTRMRTVRLTPKAIAHLDPSNFLDVASLSLDQATILRDTLEAHIATLARKGA